LASFEDQREFNRLAELGRDPARKRDRRIPLELDTGAATIIDSFTWLSPAIDVRLTAVEA
jgi:hypothetical protein